MRLCTFNVENLFTRYLFAKGVDRRRAASEGFTNEDLRFRLEDASSKRLTAEAMQAVNADVFALQEVEDLDTLKRFRDRWLGGRQAYPHVVMIDGNDPRRIDVAVLSRHPIVHVRTWQHLWDPHDDSPVFDRDCLEVDIQGPHGTPLTLFVNHFKSMRAPHGVDGPGRELTRARRALQVATVKRLVQQRFGTDPGEHAFVVLGDFNDHQEDTPEGRTSLNELLHWNALENVVDRLQPAERWTHHYQGSRRHGSPEAYRQLDYLLVSRSLAARNPGPPGIERRGLPKRARAYQGPRWPGIGERYPKASDHCPLYIDLPNV